jgi:hypothetical protein
MRVIAIVVLLTILTSFVVLPAPAYAKGRGGTDWKEALVALGLVWALGELSDDAGCRQAPAPTSSAPEPLQRAPRPLGILLITQVDGPSSTAWVTGEVLKAAGWQVVYDDDRRMAEEEQRRYGGNAQIPPARYFASVRTEFRNGREYDRASSGHYSSSGSGGREVLCTVYLRVADGAGVTFTGSGRGSSWSRYERFDWRSCGWGSDHYYTPNDDDWALLSAMVSACNGITRQAVPPASYGTPTPTTTTTAPQDGQAHFCAACGKSTPQGANFCPYCGVELAPATQPAPTNTN